LNGGGGERWARFQQRAIRDSEAVQWSLVEPFPNPWPWFSLNLDKVQFKMDGVYTLSLNGHHLPFSGSKIAIYPDGHSIPILMSSITNDESLSCSITWPFRKGDTISVRVYTDYTIQSQIDAILLQWVIILN
jgi:hypothetical protein